mgnify:CR=1 FL=1
MLKDAVNTLLNTVGKIPELFRTARSDSLIEYTRSCRAEPIVLTDSTLINQPYMTDIMQSLTAIYAGYYLQAIAISTNVGKIDIVQLLEKVNPSRSPAENAGMLIGDIVTDEDGFYGFESYKSARGRKVWALPNYSAEARVDVGHQQGMGRKTTELSQMVSNLSVGLLLEVTIADEGNSAIIPVSVRLIVSAIGVQTLLSILSHGEKDNGVKERYHAWRAGQIEFIRDNILCQDLIDDYRRTMIKDNTGTYKAIRERSNNNKIAALLSGSPSVATASNIVVMSTQTAATLESQVGAPLSSYQARQRIFEKTYMMLMVVVDTQWEQVTIYHRGISKPTEISIKQMKATNKGSGPDVAEILKAYQLGNNPQF